MFGIDWWVGGIEWWAIAAFIVAMIAVLPGSLGALFLTHNLAATAKGAKYIYGRAGWGVALAVILMAVGTYFAISRGTVSWFFVGGAAGFVGTLVFGFFMHVKMMFKPVRNPTFISVDEALEKFGPDEEVVGVIDKKGEPWAFITRLARRPHIVYQPDGSAPFIMSHCILAHSSMSYATEGKFANPDIDVTAVLANNMVFYEKNNQCAVIQMHNKSRDGELPLDTIPTVMMSLKTWKELYPDSKVWMRDIEWRDIFYLKLLARAEVIDPKSPVMVYPLQHGLDKRQPMKSNVHGVDIEGESRAYPAALFEEDGRKVLEDELGGVPIVFFSAFGGDYTNCYDREVDGKVLSFKPKGKDRFIDNETGSEWTVKGDCVKGKLKGKSVTAIPHYNKIFWYVWADFHPGTDVYDVSQPKKAGRKQAA